MALTLFLLERNQWVEILTPFLILLAYVGAFRGRLFRAVVGHPVIFTIGGMCYTIYLYHVTMIIALKPWTTRLALTQGYVVIYLLQMLLVFPIVVGASAVLFLLVEKPFMRRDWPHALAVWCRHRWVPRSAAGV
jgi:peptidoglycan/LPS O-acetylase OafA/YrhL